MDREGNPVVDHLGVPVKLEGHYAAGIAIVCDADG